jgi:tetratricopeptide (TPR) repeat protein
VFTLTRENGIIALPVILVWLALRFRSRTPGARARWAVLLASGVVLATLPVGLRNLHVGGQFHVTTWNSGPMFYIGNNARADGLHHTFRFGRGDVRQEEQDAWSLAEQEAGRALSSREVSIFWWRQTWSEIREDPVRWLDLLRRKTLLLLSAVEIADSEDQGAMASRSTVLALLSPLGFGVLLPVAMLGVVCSWDERRRLWPLHALALGYAGTVVMFFVFARYRSPLLPILMLFAAAAIAGPMPVLLRNRRWRLLGTAGALAAIALVIAYRPLLAAGDPRPSMRALHHYNVGFQLIQRGDYEGGERQIREALRIEPVANSLLAHYWLAESLRRQGRIDEARPHSADALRLGPGFAPAQLLAGEIAAEGQDWRRAIQHYRAAVRLDPELARAYLRRAEAQRALGWRRAALRSYRRYLELRPEAERVRREVERLERARRERSGGS